MGKILAVIQKKFGKKPCYYLSAIGFFGTFVGMMFLSDPLLNDSDSSKGFNTFFTICYLIFSIVFLAAGLHEPGRDEGAGTKPLRFFTVDQDGKTVLADVDTILAEPSFGYKETRRADGKFDISMEIHSKEQAVEVLAALAIMYDKGDVSSADYHRNVHKIREHFNL